MYTYGSPWFHGRGPGQAGQHVAARLRLPEGVSDGAPAAADQVVVPQPRLRVYRLTDTAQHAQAFQIMPVNDNDHELTNDHMSLDQLLA